MCIIKNPNQQYDKGDHLQRLWIIYAITIKGCKINQKRSFLFIRFEKVWVKIVGCSCLGKQVWLLWRRRVWKDIGDVAEHMVVLLILLIAQRPIDRPNGHNVHIGKDILISTDQGGGVCVPYNTPGTPVPKSIPCTIHRSPCPALTVSRPGIDFVVKCRRCCNPNTVSALWPAGGFCDVGSLGDRWVIAGH